MILELIQLTTGTNHHKSRQSECHQLTDRGTGGNVTCCPRSQSQRALAQLYLTRAPLSFKPSGCIASCHTCKRSISSLPPPKLLSGITTAQQWLGYQAARPLPQDFVCNYSDITNEFPISFLVKQPLLLWEDPGVCGRHIREE